MNFKTKFFVIFLLLSFGCGYNEKAFINETKKIVTDPNLLQEWAVTQLSRHDVGYEIPEEEWPTFLRVKGGPTSAWIAGWSTVKGNAVIVAWGGGFGHVGLIVGSKDFVITSEDFKSPVSQWIPGVFFMPRPERN